MAIGYSRNGSPREALLVYLDMLCTSIEPGNFSISVALKACVDLKDLRIGRGIHGQIVKRREKVDQVVYNTLLKLYTERGSFEDARKLFDGITFVALLSRCSDIGLSEYGLSLFERMKTEFRFSPALEHYACLVDILGRAVKIAEAVKVIETMPFMLSASMWGSLLNFCRLHRNVSVGEIAAKELFVLEPHNPGNYVMVSNIYADAKMWDNVGKTRKMMKQRGIKKEELLSSETQNDSTILLRASAHVNITGDW